MCLVNVRTVGKPQDLSPIQSSAGIVVNVRDAGVILIQVGASEKALQAVALGLVEDHMGHCVVDAARSSDEAAAAKVQEVSAAIARLLR